MGVHSIAEDRKMTSGDVGPTEPRDTVRSGGSRGDLPTGTIGCHPGGPGKGKKQDEERKWARVKVTGSVTLSMDRRVVVSTPETLVTVPSWSLSDENRVRCQGTQGEGRQESHGLSRSLFIHGLLTKPT